MSKELTQEGRDYIMAAFGRFTERNHLPWYSKCYIAYGNEIYEVDGATNSITRATEDLERAVRELKKH